jgi:hypothetical protein
MGNPEAPVFELTPGRPGPYRIGLEVNTTSGRTEVCKFELPVAGRGIRVDLCWDTSSSVDIDLYVHTPLNQNPYYTPGGYLDPAYLTTSLNTDTCNPFNCGAFPSAPRPIFGLAESPLEYCSSGPSATDFLGTGHCPNPRSGRDNNQSDATGTAEIVQIDNPNVGDVMRVMVQNYDNLSAVPLVVIYCENEQASFYLNGAPSSFVTSLTRLPGVLWRVADVRATGGSDCFITGLDHPEDPSIQYVTVNDVDY